MGIKINKAITEDLVVMPTPDVPLVIGQTQWR